MHFVITLVHKQLRLKNIKIPDTSFFYSSTETLDAPAGLETPRRQGNVQSKGAEDGSSGRRFDLFPTKSMKDDYTQAEKLPIENICIKSNTHKFTVQQQEKEVHSTMEETREFSFDATLSVPVSGTDECRVKNDLGESRQHPAGYQNERPDKKCLSGMLNEMYRISNS